MFIKILFIVLISIALVQGQTCDPSGNRTACGFIGIDQTACEGAGCCWATSTPPNPFCFKPLAAQTTTSPTTTSTTANSYAYTFYQTGGVSFCSQCGLAGAYSCSDKSSWTAGNLSFVDKTPSGYAAVSFTVTTTGSYACGIDYQSSIIASVQDSVVGTSLVSASSDHCACNTCDGAVEADSPTYPWGFNLNYGGKNSFSINVQMNPICLYSISLEVFYAPVYAYYSTSFRLNPSSASSSAPLCGASSFLSCYSGSSSSKCTFGYFNDPLPSGSLLIGTNIEFIGNWFPTRSSYSSCPTKVSATVSLAGQTLPSSVITRTDGCWTTGYCAAPWSFSTSSLYQNGLAGYSYGTSNVVSISPYVNEGYADYIYLAYADIILYYISQ